MTEETKKGEIAIYKAEGGPELRVRFEGETVWLNLQQIAGLFGRDKSVISRHLNGIFKDGELDAKTTVAKNATVQTEGKRVIERQIEYYNLDAVISVGYRVSSKRATQFRIWATQRLKDYLLKGYAVNNRRLKEEHGLKLKELQNTSRLFRQVLESRRAEGYEKDLLKIITDYSGTWAVLNKYDKGELGAESAGRRSSAVMDYESLGKTIQIFKKRLAVKKEAGSLFGQEVGEKFKAILGNIGQTFGNRDLFASLEEKAANLFYSMVNDRPFADGNKRIGSLVFMIYLVQSNALYSIKTGERKINENTLAALALLIAESKPEQKETMVKLIINLINQP